MESINFPNIYLETDNRAGVRKDAVCARPEIPPKDNNCIAIMYFIGLDVSYSESRVIPLLISIFPRSSKPGIEKFCMKFLQKLLF